HGSVANTSFSLALFRKLSDNDTTANIFYSPFSISSALAMVLLGARGNTAAQMSELEKLLTYDNFMEWTRPEMMKEVEVQVGLPRFKMEEKCNMKNILVSMGMVDAFDVAASDFSGMSPANDLVLSEVIHKAFVEVNEEGTEAAAATGVVFTLLCAVFPQNFYADHPFLFFIRHNPSRNILFAGRYCSPE
uniref:Serpin B6 n=1 Tax=Takifugu rubripes TaxID=31033 RepID=A0A674NUI4_TAKRU